ncbi:hypothetical protein DAEQUDRAFT_768233 [Daedalea quercina L-15889]|uniref:Uncharacterized protein n=1 Tax=Daedalea quercina L-15889 TaxID=1314783 RepID=A0A165MWC7_9APHY|nr:hypothetical protein DAEQUDRAFT_768233 [Daedalea quercina L-15889]
MANLDSEPLPPYTRFADVPPNYDPDKALADFNALSSNQKKGFSSGMAKAASRKDATPQFEQAANAAADAAKNVDEMFVSLTAKLMSLEDTESFVEKFNVIKQHYRDVVTDSHGLAVDIAQYAESFDKIVVKFCADTTLTVERRKKKIEEFIAKGDDIKSKAGTMDGRFTDLIDEFTDFVGSFKDWAKTREEADQKKIKQLLKEIGEITETIGKIDTAMKVIAGALALTLPITGILAVCFPPAAPFIIGIGCAIAGVELGSLTGLAIARNILLNQKATKEGQITDLQNEISKIKAARTQLEERGQADLNTFTVNIRAISGVWVHVQNDAQAIHKWLQDGADDADQPDYMKASLEEAVAVYTAMATYLKNYANGVTSTVQMFNAST